jgi:HAD superfamily phosphatase (TIGR01668 family)
MLRLVTPHYRVSSVGELTPGQLRQWGLSALLLDVDCTLTRYRQEAPPEILAWVTELRAAGIGLCLVSNGMGRRISRFAERLALPCIFKAMKPLPWGVRAGMRRLQAAAAETAMVGDQLFADIVAGRLAGIRTILVNAIHPEDEPWFTRLKRGPEGFLLRRLKP